MMPRDKMNATFGAEYRTRQLLLAQRQREKLWRHHTSARRRAVLAAYRAAGQVVQRYAAAMTAAFKSISVTAARAADAMKGFSRALEPKEQ